jgi:hypothetical protein
VLFSLAHLSSLHFASAADAFWPRQQAFRISAVPLLRVGHSERGDGVRGHF